MNFEELARRCTHLGIASPKSIQSALEFEQATRKLSEQNLDSLHAEMERVSKDLLRMADEMGSAEKKNNEMV